MGCNEKPLLHYDRGFRESEAPDVTPQNDFDFDIYCQNYVPK